MFNTMDIIKALNILELEDKTIIRRLQSAPSFDIACQVVEDLHCIVRKQRRLLSKKYHPDVGGDEERFKIINHVCDKLLDIKVQPVVQRPIIHHTVIIRSSYGTTSTTSTTGYW